MSRFFFFFSGEWMLPAAFIVAGVVVAGIVLATICFAASGLSWFSRH